MTMMAERARSLTTLPVIVIIILIGQIGWQAWQLHELRTEMGFNQRHFNEQIGRLAAERLHGHREDVVRATQWLHEYYASADGLQRPNGLWLDQEHHPDFEAIGAWVFDVYLNARVNGAPDAEARQAVVDAIHGTDEWRRIHARR
jgi:hypothetical protein